MKKIKILLFIMIIAIYTSSLVLAKTSVNEPDTVRLKLNDGSVVTLDWNEYLYGVVNAEMGTSYKVNGEIKQIKIDALKAQAIASRTFAMYILEHPKYDDCDITTKDQAYKSDNIKDIIKQAVDSTLGQVMTYNGEIINSFFFSTSGGHTESSENIWSAKLPYVRGVEDPYEPYIDKNSEWEVRIPADKYR